MISRNDYGKGLLSETIIFPGCDDSIVVEYGTVTEDSGGPTTNRRPPKYMGRTLFKHGFEMLKNNPPQVAAVDLDQYTPDELLFIGILDNGEEFDIKRLLDTVTAFGSRPRSVSSLLGGLRTGPIPDRYLFELKKTSTGVADDVDDNIELPSVFSLSTRLLLECVKGKFVVIIRRSWSINMHHGLLMKMDTEEQFKVVMGIIDMCFNLCTGEDARVVKDVIMGLTETGRVFEHSAEKPVCLTFGMRMNNELFNRSMFYDCAELLKCDENKVNKEEEDDETKQKTWSPAVHTIVSMLREAEGAGRPLGLWWRQTCESNGSSLWRDADVC